MAWNSCHMTPINIPSSPLDWNKWFSSNLLQSCNFSRNIPWNITFTFICWHIWKWRCNCVFDSSFNLPYDMKSIIAAYIEEWSIANKPKENGGLRKTVSMQWIKPPTDILKINVDGSQDRNGNIGAGGVMRNSNGDWCGGFIVNLGTGNIDQAEAWGVFYGLQMALNHGVQKVEVECDSSTVINLLHNEENLYHPLGIIIKNCKDISKNFITCHTRHVHRERNTVADILAKSSLLAAKGISWLANAPSSVANAILDDIAGLSKLRTIYDTAPPHSNPDMQIDADLLRQGRQVNVAPTVLQVQTNHLDNGVERLRGIPAEMTLPNNHGTAANPTDAYEDLTRLHRQIRHNDDANMVLCANNAPMEDANSIRQPSSYG